MSIDIFYSDGETTKSRRHQELVSNVSVGKKRMRELSKDNKHGIVMYVRTDSSWDNKQYFFERGKIIFIKDNYGN